MNKLIRARGLKTVLAVAAALVAAPSASPLLAVPDEAVPGPVAARVLAVIDGDTIAVRARIWLGQSVETNVRFSGVDAPELRGACGHERELALAARDFVVVTLGDGEVVLRDIRYDKYGGRVVARVESGGGADLAALLIDAGLGRAYDGRARPSWCAAPD